MSAPAIVGVAAAVVPSSARRHRRRRERAVVAVLLAVVLALFVLTMMVGSYRLSPLAVVESLLGLSDDPSVDFIVRDLRLPVATTGLAVGLALGLSGIVFQKLLANPLASPDFVGISQGASVAAVLSIVIFHLGAVAVAGAALAGALLAGLLIYLLAWKGGVTGYRFILVGIGVSEFCIALIGYVLAKAQLFDAREAMAWLVGSIGQAGALQLRILLVALVVLLPVALLLGRWLGALELGDDAAHALGVRVEVARVVLLAVAIVLVALATAAAGPVSFVALVSGPIAVRIVRTGGPVLLPSALVGAALVLLADVVAVHLMPAALPTGVVTGAVGAPYLIWLLATVNSEGRGG